jgi:hypothetical protein
MVAFERSASFRCGRSLASSCALGVGGFTPAARLGSLPEPIPAAGGVFKGAAFGPSRSSPFWAGETLSPRLGAAFSLWVRIVVSRLAACAERGWEAGRSGARRTRRASPCERLCTSALRRIRFHSAPIARERPPAPSAGLDRTGPSCCAGPRCVSAPFSLELHPARCSAGRGFSSEESACPVLLAPRAGRMIATARRSCGFLTARPRSSRTARRRRCF